MKVGAAKTLGSRVGLQRHCHAADRVLGGWPRAVDGRCRNRRHLWVCRVMIRVVNSF